MGFLERSRKFSAVAGFAAFFGLGLFFFGKVLSGNPANQPIRFNHAVHVTNGMACEDCHVGARAAERATIPGIDICMGCHAEALTKSPEEEKIRAIAQMGNEIPWVQITHVPRHVYFSHRRHAALGNLNCADCHGAMDKRSEPPGRPFRAMDMNGCIDCHEQRKVSHDCNDCHR